MTATTAQPGWGRPAPVTAVGSIGYRLWSLRCMVDEAYDNLQQAQSQLAELTRSPQETDAALVRSLSSLTRQERKIAQFVAAGLTNAEVAAAAHLTEGTVKSHLKGIFRKLGLHSRWELTYVLDRASFDAPRVVER